MTKTIKKNIVVTSLLLILGIYGFACKTIGVSVSETKESNDNLIVKNAYQEYLGRNADGTDINAMLSYFPLSLMTNRNSRSTWDDYFILLNEYLVMAEQEHISQNYSLVAGTNEIFVVSNFFASVISGAKQNGMKFTEVPYHLSSTAQELLLKIHNNEYKKNE